MTTRQRIDDTHGFVLHTYPWRETSLIVETFTREHGRLPLMAKGARRPGSAVRGVLMAFQPLAVSWTGKSEVKTLTGAYWLGGQALLCGIGLLCGYYLNELLLRLLPREDPHPVLFDRYAATIRALAEGAPTAPLLRSFELALLQELGYGLTLDVLADTGEVVQPDGRYWFVAERGVLEAHDEMGDSAAQGSLLDGHVLLAMASDDFSGTDTLAQAKGLMRRLLQHHLGGQQLESRRILIELQEL
ncbi:DNA repair protein RecO [Uliginosibacterium sp. H3]|uniref:DNA repair protein RecO n=1 Tax=Uliginosibacterium silvisoli TaxID=3114758 RepID=A0ABU6K9E7_9RHOO|nr:DNA repair protein RecO [Uliginosibacterium sp. H3]